MTYFSRFVGFWAFFLTVFFCSAAAHGQVRNVAVAVRKLNEVIFAPGETTKTMNFAFYSTSSSTSTITLDLKAPNKAVISARSLGFKNAPALDAGVAQIKSGYVQEISAAGNFTKQLTVGGNTSSGGQTGSSGYICNGYSQAIYKPYYLEQFKKLYGRSPTSDDDLCDGIFGDAWRTQGSGNGSDGSSSGGGTSSPGDASGSLYITSHVLKDACDRTSKYLVMFTLDMSNIAASERAAGFKISLDIKEAVFSGGMQASLKPVSDGKYAPNPLVLTALISTGDKHMYTRWSSGAKKILSSATTKGIVKYTPWQGLILGASLPPPLAGGKMTVFTFDTQSAYGVCFSATRTRQRYNGYPD